MASMNFLRIAVRSAGSKSFSRSNVRMAWRNSTGLARSLRAKFLSVVNPEGCANLTVFMKQYAACAHQSWVYSGVAPIPFQVYSRCGAVLGLLRSGTYSVQGILRS